jgi:hypothetical protein
VKKKKPIIKVEPIKEEEEEEEEEEVKKGLTGKVSSDNEVIDAFVNKNGGITGKKGKWKKAGGVRREDVILSVEDDKWWNENKKYNTLKRRWEKK